MVPFGTRSAGHLGIQKNTLKIRQSFMWHGMTRDIELFVKSCNVCNQNKRANVKAKAALGSYHAGFPGDRVHIDLLGPFTPSDKGNQYILVIVDQFTK